MNDHIEPEDVIAAFIQDYKDARADGLCHEGAWEVALSRLTTLTISPALLQLLEVMLPDDTIQKS